MPRLVLAAAAAACLLPAAADAHDAYWLKQSGGAHLIAWGHPGEAPGRYDVDAVLDAALYGPQGVPLDADRSEQDGQVRLAPSGDRTAAMAAFTFNPGDTIQTAEGRYTAGSKADHPGYRRAFHSVRFGKALYAWSPRFAEPIGAELEWVPADDPFSVTGPVTLQLLHEGAPLAGAEVTVSTGEAEQSLATDADGRVAVSLAEAGETMIVADHAIPIESETVDERALNAVLTIAR